MRYLRARSRNGFISFISAVSIVGIALAVAVLIVVLSVMNGFEHEMQKRILGMVSDATLTGLEETIDDWQALRATALERDDIVAAAPYVEASAMVVAGEEMAGVVVRGVEPELERQVSTIEEPDVMREGSLDALVPGEWRILIGSQLAALLGVSIGDEVVLVSGEARITPQGPRPSLKQVTVGGIFNAGMYEYDRGLVLMNMSDAATLFRTGGKATGLRLDVVDLYNARAVAESFALQLRVERAESYRVDDWTRRHSIFLRSIELQKTMLFIMLTLVIAVAAFNIVSTLMMVVRDKRSDIAIMRTFGVGPRSILAIFASQGTLIGVVGAVSGVLLAMLVASQLGHLVNLLERWFDIDLLNAEVYFLSELPTQLRPGEIAEIAGLAFALALLATLYPALRAARTRPAEALRHE
jgi:lipoprotein-releasing system permease protein